MAECLNMKTRSDCARMTAEQAQSVLQELAELEFPTFFGGSVFFALFKTYAVPTISPPLVFTNELLSKSIMVKLTADTGLLLCEMRFNKPSSSRSKTALARINYLHSKYRMAGAITNNDMLYTLSLFALEPIRWIDKFEWRPFTQLERHAAGTCWKAIGGAMDISYAPLPSFGTGWREGLSWLQEVEACSTSYEKDNVALSSSSANLANALLHHMLVLKPTFMQSLINQLVAAIPGERTRKAMRLPRAFSNCLHQFLLRYRAA